MLLDKVFAKFLVDSRVIEPTQKADECTRRHKDSINQFYPNEYDCVQKLRAILNHAGFIFTYTLTMPVTQIGYKKPPGTIKRFLITRGLIYFPVQILAGLGPCCLYREVLYIGGFLYRDFTVLEVKNGVGATGVLTSIFLLLRIY